jgi:predicted ester cyclase
MRRFVLVALAVVTLGIGARGDTSPLAVAQDATPAAECPATTPEENKDLVRRFVEEVYTQRDPSRVDAFLADDFNRTSPHRPHTNEPGNADDAARVERSLVEFPDYESTIEELIAEDDKVMVLMRIRGTHQGDFADLGVEATGRAAEWWSVIIWRVECGLLAENWVVTDRLTTYRHLGIITDDELATVGTPTVATPVP